MTERYEGCTACGWTGSYGYLVAATGDDDLCPCCSRKGTMTTYYIGEDGVELREHELASTDRQEGLT